MPLAFQIVFAVAVTTYMLETGLAAPRGGMWEALRTKKGELARGLVVMIVIGPLVATLIARALALPDHTADALVILSAVGVVPMASRGARRRGGDASLAVLLTALLGLAAAFTAAPTARFLLGYERRLDAPVGGLLLQVLALQGLPIALGMLIGRYSRRADAIERFFRTFNKAVIVAVVVAALVILPRYGSVRALGGRGVLAGVAFALLVSAAGYALGGPRLAARRTLAMVANLPNVSLALVLVTSAGATAGFAIAMVGMFLVRIATGLAVAALVARRSPDTEAPRISSRRKLALVPLAGALVLGVEACEPNGSLLGTPGATVVVTRFAPGTDFGGYRTFAIGDSIAVLRERDVEAGLPTEEVDPALATQTLDAIVGHLTSRGYQQVPQTDRPDLGVSVVAVVRVNASVPYGAWWGGGSASGGFFGVPGDLSSGIPGAGGAGVALWQSGVLVMELYDLRAGRALQTAATELPAEGPDAGSSAAADAGAGTIPVVWAGFVYGVVGEGARSTLTAAPLGGIQQAFDQSPYLRSR